MTTEDIADEKAGYDDMYYGIQVACKGLLTKENGLNLLSLKII